MIRKSLINFGLLICFAILRYGLMGSVYARSDLETVGHINALLTFVTMITFIAGFEAHHVVNRQLLFGQSSKLRWGWDRQVFALLTIGTMALLVNSFLVGTNFGNRLKLLVFLVAGAEYLALELGRLLIVKERFLVATVCGFARSVSPFLLALTTSPTLETILYSWLLGTTAVLVIQVAMLRATYLRFEWRLLDRANYHATASFFVAGVSMAAVPIIERWLVGTFFSAAVLGQYALAIALASVCEMVLQGCIWQPFIARILSRLKQPTKRFYMVGALLAAIAVVYIGACGLAMLLSSHLLAWINKVPLPQTMLVGVFTLGLAKALYTLLFYCFYASGLERMLPKVQGAIVAAMVLVVVMSARAGLDAGTAFAAAGVVWTSLLLVLILRWTASGGQVVAG
jgi:hypothetical protein